MEFGREKLSLWGLIIMLISSIIMGIGAMLGMKTGERIWARGEREYESRMNGNSKTGGQSQAPSNQ